MRRRENYVSLYIAGVLLAVGILVLVQMYLLGEPERIQAVQARDDLLVTTAGRTTYADNCTMCHGDNGEGVDGPPLRDKGFLHSTSDETIFSVVSSGVPGTAMPAWNQAHGGPFTDQEIRGVTAFLRSWEEGAPDLRSQEYVGDPQEGLRVYSATCVVCHGPEGQTNGRVGPSLAAPKNLEKYDDEWYEKTIAAGRPAKGMPTWGTVLSPETIVDLVALLRAWQHGETVELPGPGEYLHEATHQIDHGNLEEAIAQLEEAVEVSSGPLLDRLEEAVAALKVQDVEAAKKALDRAKEMTGGAGSDGSNREGAGAVRPGENEVRAAMEDLARGDLKTAQAKLKVAQVLADDALSDAIEHAVADIEVGKLDEARGLLEEAVGNGNRISP